MVVALGHHPTPGPTYARVHEHSAASVLDADLRRMGEPQSAGRGGLGRSCDVGIEQERRYGGDFEAKIGQNQPTERPQTAQLTDLA